MRFKCFRFIWIIFLQNFFKPIVWNYPKTNLMFSIQHQISQNFNQPRKRSFHGEISLPVAVTIQAMHPMNRNIRCHCNINAAKTKHKFINEQHMGSLIRSAKHTGSEWPFSSNPEKPSYHYKVILKCWSVDLLRLLDGDGMCAYNIGCKMWVKKK